MPSNSVEAYQIGVLCALPKEMLAAKAMLDEEHGRPTTRDAQDNNNYILGQVQEHNIVIACLPAGVYGTNAAATTANNMLRTFPNIRFSMMVGIGGGIPKPTNPKEIRLGDVAVSQPKGTLGGAVQYDRLKRLKGGKFERIGNLNQPPTVLLTALSLIQAQPATSLRQLNQHMSTMQQRITEEDEGYSFPGVDQDNLFCTKCDRSLWSVWWWLFWFLTFWLNPLWSCGSCDQGVIRRPLDRTNTKLHYGIIASGNVLLKDSMERDQLRKKFDAVCVETEAAGLMNDFPCLVIRGICDYADSHKNDIWQKYAALVAAAFAKTLLLVIPPTAVQSLERATTIMEIKDLRTHELLDENNRLQREGIEANQHRYLSERERKCHQAFKMEGSYEEFKDINPRKVVGTCEWVLNHPQYQAWQQSTTQDLLWISADPGCGKSVLARSLVDSYLVETNQRSICYFFFKDNPAQDKLTTALCAILHQLFHYQPSLLCHALPVFDKFGDKIRYESGEMWRILYATASDQSAQPIICVFDALDECQDKDRQQLIERLCDFHQSSRHGSSDLKLKFLVTSRPYDDVQRWFQNTTAQFPQIWLRGEVENDQINKEINLVIDRRVDELADEFYLSNHNQKLLRDRLKQMNHRTYLWLYLAYEGIRATYQASFNPNRIRIESLPKTVEDAYEIILAKIPEKSKSLARRVLMIIIGAKRPFTVQEMGLALGAAEAFELDLSEISAIDSLRLEKQIRNVCGLFVFCNHSRFFLIHQTAKEFLVAQATDFIAPSTAWKFSFREADIQAELGRLCAAFLYLRTNSFKGVSYDVDEDSSRDTDESLFSTTDVSEGNFVGVLEEFFDYCAINWTLHLQDDAIIADARLFEMVKSLYRTESSLFWAWFYTMRRAQGYTERIPFVVKTQHAASMCGHSSVLRQIINTTDIDLDDRDTTGRTALRWAIENNHESTVKMLIDSGANVNMMETLEYPCGKVTSLSLITGDDDDEDDGVANKGEERRRHFDLLQIPGIGNYNKIAEVISQAGFGENLRVHQDGPNFNFYIRLEAKSHPHKQEQFGSISGTTLGLQSRAREITQSLIDGGVEVKTDWDETPLSAASECGHESIVRMLLAAGADVNAYGELNGGALRVASSKGYDSIVCMLLDAGVDMNAHDEYDRTALFRASQNGHDGIVRMLLAAGADVNTSDYSDETALFQASKNGHDGIVRMLLDAGADIDAHDEHDETALYKASVYGHDGIVRILLAAGADVNARDQDSITALFQASRNGHESIVRMLLAAGADVNADGGWFGSAVNIARERRHDKIVQLLLDAGATEDDGESYDSHEYYDSNSDDAMDDDDDDDEME